ncbi:protein MODIFYING WALL LIGNIN-1-like isoform X2 [Ricinus communis]|uniref:protein MODIFYING WALL LIGNIN-1-like isoform X2 n=1 Tax=Ricinus communis TaxID=3988 RepID=UPI00201B0F51|nr:protein MODIFYING WALL LIGNIN-1-like isoform X2 [Ricinus communis]XP_048230861.1 protein MODIFYING WALL LIGNIN-1-like isoform X2 [Ricinus communis]
MTKKLRRVSLLQSNRKTSSEESFKYHKGMHHTRVLPLLFLEALGFGIAALACLIVAQTIGNVVICCNLCLRKDGDTCKARKAKTATAFLVLSWVSFGAAAILLSTATSMGREQEYGKGWLDQECYLVKDGVYFGSGFLVLLSIAATLVSVLFSIRKTQGEQGRKIHAQVV